MILMSIIFALSLGLTVFFFVFFEFYTEFYYYFLLIPFFIGSFIAVCAAYGIIMVICSFIIRLKKTTNPNKLIYFFVKETSWFIYFFSRIRVKVYNKELEPKREKYLIISNHKSGFDPFLLYKILRTNPYVMVTKPQNLEVPVFGSWIKYSGSIVMKRETDIESVKAVVQAIKYIKDGIASVGIYPEGKRNFENDTILELHPGSFKIAIKSRCPIVITLSKNTENIKKIFPRKSKVEFKFIKVLRYEDYKDMNTLELSRLCYNIMVEEYKKDWKIEK